MARLREFLHRLNRRLCDRRGVAAVEFALILPVMLVMWLGGIEVTQAVTVNRLVALTALTVTNLVAQYTTISASSQMPDILNASVQVMAPYPSTNVSVVVSCITIDSNKNATVTWSKALNGTVLVAAPAIPSDLNVAGTTLIFGQVNYSYSPAVDFMKLGPFNLSSSVYMAPRNSSTVVMTN